jgi:hypothetical protein
MPINSVQGAAIPNGANFNAAQRSDAILAISQVKLSDCWRLAPGGGGRTISTTPCVRVDVQSVSAAGVSNVQAQLNGVNGNSTIAHVQLAPSIGVTSGPRADAQLTYAIRQIRGALGNSLANGTTYTLTGTPT